MTAVLALLGNWRMLLAILAVAALGAGWIWVETLRSDARIQKALAAQYEASLKSVQRDLTASREAEAFASAETETIRQAADEAAKKVHDYETYLRTRPARACALDGADVERLRRID